MSAKTSRRFLLVAAPFVYATPLSGAVSLVCSTKIKQKLSNKQIVA
nr:MAG TPA: hypothetical protein [Caudoviricetes sp.]